jgi:hypothetical protein
MFAVATARMAGRLSVVPIRRAGFYENGLPAGIPFRRRLFTMWLELSLRLRLFFVGAIRGVRGTGVLGIGRLYASVIRASGGVEHLGLVCTKVITNAGVTFLRDDFNAGGQDVSTLKFHGAGTGTTAENVTDTALVTESTTALNPDSTRATGTQATNGTNVYRTVGTLTFDATAAITEHGVFNQAATGGGTLWDRSVFTAINVATGDSIQFTYDCTFSAGG